MAYCFVLNSAGELVADPTPVAQCTAFIVQDASDYLAQSIFTIPSPSSLNTAFAAGFILPMTIGLIAWGIGELVNFWND